ncbi:hypothetical protein B0T17DRAFT_509083 [Bombardia bombarda]|uniref:Uncharacterized protein n=1 Tax=Bombardia bombarda TaxID=252184 RepID=A0AA39WUB5_9PEZI|nr:hypothetical protein B0T17DRAFT_509083 [Bombardia bombarda]
MSQNPEENDPKEMDVSQESSPCYFLDKLPVEIVDKILSLLCPYCRGDEEVLSHKEVASGNMVAMLDRWYSYHEHVNASRKALASLTRTCSPLNNIATPHLYHQMWTAESNRALLRMQGTPAEVLLRYEARKRNYGFFMRSTFRLEAILACILFIFPNVRELKVFVEGQRILQRMQNPGPALMGFSEMEQASFQNLKRLTIRSYTRCRIYDGKTTFWNEIPALFTTPMISLEYFHSDRLCGVFTTMNNLMGGVSEVSLDDMEEYWCQNIKELRLSDQLTIDYGMLEHEFGTVLASLRGSEKLERLVWDNKNTWITRGFPPRLQMNGWAYFRGKLRRLTIAITSGYFPRLKTVIEPYKQELEDHGVELVYCADEEYFFDTKTTVPGWPRYEVLYMSLPTTDV